ncbi:MAG: alpha/beta hydrolase [Candidatus Omnitrophota bacterium]
MIRKSKCVFLLFVLFISLKVGLLYAGETYYPSPIIFVHGLNSDPSAWNTTEKEFKKYFYNDDGSCKYFEYGDNYLIKADYESQNNGDIPTIARTTLKNELDNAVNKLPDGYKKVNIVAHSMGGLVTRSLLKQYPDCQSSINRAVFIGTPHLGAPSASALWILNKINNSSLDDMITKYSRFYSASAFTGFRFKPINYSPSIFSSFSAKLARMKSNIALLLKAAKDSPYLPDPDSVAIEELRLAGNVNYYASILDFSPFQLIKEDILLGHSGSETFLGQNNLSNPVNYKTIRGKNAGWGKTKARVLNSLLDNFDDNFTFPSGQSLTDAKDTGDGIVTRASQEGIGPADYTIDAFHTDEPNDYQTILQALDDKPVIESVRVVATNEENSALSWYVIFKVKDYLLADIEISDIKLGHIFSLQDLDLYNTSEFYEPETRKYKPYVKFGKDFLREREDKNAPVFDDNGDVTYLHLQPGEFYLRLCWLSSGYIKIRNAAQKETNCEFLKAPVSEYIQIKKIGSAEGISYSPIYSSVREQAYNNFLARNEYIYWHDKGDNIQGGIYGEGINNCFYRDGTEQWVYSSYAYMDSLYSYGKFDSINIGDDKRIKSIYTLFLSGKNGEDFNILFYRYNSNDWPPASNFGTGSFLFSFNVADHNNHYGDYFYAVQLNPNDIALNGSNIWIVKPDFGEYNCIPAVVPTNGELSAFKSFSVSFLSLFVVIEDK